MGKINEIYLRDTRDQLGRYPNWPINQQIALGKIGTYFGRKATFSWETDLQSLGIAMTVTNPQQVMSELYTTEDAVTLSFGFDTETGVSKAKFDFSKKRAVATQGHDVGYQVIDIRKLRTDLLSKIDSGLQWDYNWVIITEVWVANGFTVLISNSTESYTEISTKPEVKMNAFNIADFNLGLKVTGSRKMGYQGVAKENVQPYFQIHRLTQDKKLKLYGPNTSFWG